MKITQKAFIAIDDEQQMLVKSISEYETKAEKYAIDAYGYEKWEYLKKCGAQIVSCTITAAIDE